MSLMPVAKAVLATVRLSGPLHEAALEVIKSGEAPPDYESATGGTPLSLAAYAGNENLVRALLREGASPNFPNRHGRTPLMAAAAGGSHVCVGLLLHANAELEAIDLYGRMASAHATQAGFPDVALLLLVHQRDKLPRHDTTTFSN